MPLYEPLREGLRELRTIVSEDQANAREHQLKMSMIQRQATQDKAQMDIQLAQIQRQQQARDMLAEGIAQTFTVDPVADRQRGLAEVSDKLASAKEQRRYMTPNDRTRNPKGWLALNQDIATMESDTARISKELQDPLLLAREYESLATEANKYALQVGALDPNLIAPLQQFAGQRLAQGKALRGEYESKERIGVAKRQARTAEQRNQITARGQDISRNVAGERIQLGVEQMLSREQQAGLDRDLRRELADKDRALRESLAGIKNAKAKDYVFKSLNQVRSQIMPEADTTDAMIVPDKNSLYNKISLAVTNFASKKPQSFVSEADAANATLRIMEKLVNDHNTFVRELNDVIADSSMSQEDKNDAIAAYEEMTKQVMGYVPQTFIGSEQVQ